ncbi:hypothetical protein MTR67_013996 [Solanum verrucosum]|uniref:Uncharacterized protein n=1 Tax=Solanum verrucosum TaxID=315347 RepID=A0AAF0QC99_SOLVR|nr:hypothetical protein MTR67_013996 [Solanum verrucosum]
MGKDYWKDSVLRRSSVDRRCDFAADFRYYKAAEIGGSANLVTIFDDVYHIWGFSTWSCLWNFVSQLGSGETGLVYWAGRSSEELG